MKQGRDQKGQFSSKGKEFREVRSLRLTNSAWEKLGKIAKERGITRADLIEDFVMQDETFSLVSTNNQDVIYILESALRLKANAGGAIKDKVKEVLVLLKGKL